MGQKVMQQRSGGSGLLLQLIQANTAAWVPVSGKARLPCKISETMLLQTPNQGPSSLPPAPTTKVGQGNQPSPKTVTQGSAPSLLHVCSLPAERAEKDNVYKSRGPAAMPGGL